MRAVVLRTLGGPDTLAVEERDVPVTDAGAALVRLRAAALNRRDLWIRQGKYAGIRLPVVLGSDGAGTVAAVGDGVDPAWLGRDVVVDPAFNWGPDRRAQGPGFSVLGMPADGTYAQFISVPASHLHVKPPHLSFEEAAAVPLAGVTAYRALVTRASLQYGESVVVTGIGGGVATAALVIATHLGGRVYVTSGSDDKLAAATRVGAVGGVNYHHPGWREELVGQIGRRPDVVVDGAGGAVFDQALDLVRPGGRVVSYGATLGAAPALEVRRIFWKQLDVLGSTMGTARDFAEMMALYSLGLRPVIDRVYPLAEASRAHERMEQGAQFGKVVLRIPE